MRYILHTKNKDFVFKLREDHINTLYTVYKVYGMKSWRSDIEPLIFDKRYRQYFIDRMRYPFHFIDWVKIPKDQKKGLKQNEKNMFHYKITSEGIKLFIYLGLKVNDEDIASTAKETLRK